MLQKIKGELESILENTLSNQSMVPDSEEASYSPAQEADPYINGMFTYYCMNIYILYINNMYYIDICIA